MLVQVTVAHAFEQVYQVRLQAEHDALRLGVAHAYVVLDDVRLAAHIHQSQEDETFVEDAFVVQAVDGRFDDAGAHLLHERVVGKGYGRHAAHAPGVQSGVAFAHALVVFGHRQDLVMSAVGQDEDAALDTAQVLFNQHRSAGVAEHAAQHGFQLAACLIQRGEYQDAFASAETIGLQHVRSRQSGEKVQSGDQRVACHAEMARCGDAVAQHERLGEVLAAFQPCARTGGADDGNVARGFVFLESVVNALHQRVFRTDDHHIDAALQSEGFQAREVGRPDVDILAHAACSGIARGDVEFLHFVALGYLPRQCVFAAARAE